MKWMDVNGVSLRYELSNANADKQTVVLIHELGGSLDSWDETLAHFQHDFRTLRYDQRGFGHSEKVSGTLALGDMVVATGGSIGGIGEPTIDHVALTPDLAPREVIGLSRFDDDGRALSDHFGVVVRFGRP